MKYEGNTMLTVLPIVETANLVDLGVSVSLLDSEHIVFALP